VVERENVSVCVSLGKSADKKGRLKFEGGGREGRRGAGVGST